MFGSTAVQINIIPFPITSICSVSEKGLVKGAEKIFIGEKNSKDYHEEMNGPHFEDHIRCVICFSNVLS